MGTDVAHEQSRVDPQVVEALEALESAVLDLGLVVSSNTEALNPEANESFKSYVEDVVRMSKAIRSLRERRNLSDDRP